MTEIEYNWFLTMYQHLVCYLVIFMCHLHNKAKQEVQIIIQNSVSIAKLYIQQKTWNIIFENEGQEWPGRNFNT